MVKIIGMKELQTKTKQIRQEVEKGVNFIVIWRSKPVFEIKPVEKSEGGFAMAFRKTNLYTEDFLQRLEEAEEDLTKGKVETFSSPEGFLKSLS